MPGRYDYEEIRAAAIAPGATQDEINALGDWLEQYGGTAWNGEYFDADDGIRVYPVYDWDEENDVGILKGYEIK